MKRWDVGTYGVYAAVKAATQQITRAAANEWGKDGIRVNCIMPHATSEDDIGAFVAMMCRDEARYLTGQTIALDGGQAFTG